MRMCGRVQHCDFENFVPEPEVRCGGLEEMLSRSSAWLITSWSPAGAGRSGGGGTAGRVEMRAVRTKSRK